MDKLNKKNLSALLIPLGFVLLLLVISPYHETFEEFDGVMQFLAAKELAMFRGCHPAWAFHFWPPLYALLTGVTSKFMDGFLGAKIISHLAGMGLLYIAYHFANKLVPGPNIGLLTQLFLVVNPVFVKSALQAENHMLEALFFVSALWLLLEVAETKRGMFVVLAGLASGFAGLTRYTSYVLLPLGILMIFRVIEGKRTIFYSSIFLLSFALISAPWWLCNASANGAPFHTWQYLNIGSAVVPVGGSQWWWRAQARFGSLWEILNAYPRLYWQNLLRNFVKSFSMVMVVSGVLAPFAIPAVFKGFLELKPKSLLLIFGGLGLFVLAVSQAFIFDAVFLSWSVPLTAISVFYLRDFVLELKRRFPKREFLKFPLVIAVLFVIAGGLTYAEVTRYLKSDNEDQGRLVDYRKVVTILKESDPDIHKKYIMADHPAWAYGTGSYYLALPQYYPGEIDALVSYQDLPTKIKRYAPKFPTFTDNLFLRADYLIMNRYTQVAPASYDFLFTPNSDHIPEHFENIYHSDDLVVYRIRWENE